MSTPRSTFRRPVAALPALVLATAGLVVGAAFAGNSPAPAGPPKSAPASARAGAPVGRVTKSDAEWRRVLGAESYRVLRQKGTERAFTGKSWNEHRAGTYACAGCGLELFSSKTKYDSGTGWPSFWAPVAANHVRELPDLSYGAVNTEIVCARCDGHLGHVFDDGPKPTGLRYCMNSAALTFTPASAPKR